MINITNFLLSGFNFKEEEYELKLQFILVNSILTIIIVMLSFLSFLRYISHQEVQAIIDTGAVVASLITLITARRSKKSINISIPLLLALFYFLITFTFRNIGIIGTTWYIVLILAAFFLKGKKVGLFFSAISVLAILSLEQFSDAKYTMFQYFYITIPIILSMTFLYLYEQRNEILNSLLKKQKSLLEEEVKKQTNELSQLLLTSQELASIMKNSLIEIYIVDFKTDHYLYVNDGVIKTLGYSEDELLAMNIYDINTSMIHETVTRFKELMLKNGNATNISQHRRKDGSSYGVQSFMHKISYNNKEAYVIFDIQISDAQKAQSAILKQKETLAYQAHYDTLTKLPNRVLFEDRLTQAIAKAKRKYTKFALLFVDLDHFKDINDTYGHEVGDIVLKEIAKRLQNCVRESDTVSRLSGDEFLIILEEFDSKESVATIAKLLIESIRIPIEFHDKKLIVTCSIGISLYPDDAKHGQTLVKYADRAMYNAKNIGKNNFKFYR
ncbi:MULTISPECIES: GGDEF domain-containing protein [Sulfurimonas]|uniref:GGDEF domain-containing protein n=1 Tax=Sulfurimonas TaxID=202746 RepID=UPI0012649F4D|nr:GGDEF domain-containing protein [Sulfurimonas indica]